MGANVASFLTANGLKVFAKSSTEEEPASVFTVGVEEDGFDLGVGAVLDCFGFLKNADMSERDLF